MENNREQTHKQKTQSIGLTWGWLRFASVFLFMFFLNINVAASMVSFYMIETGLPDNGKTFHQSVSWEDAFLEVFFDGGFIVSNAPILRLENKPEDDILHYVDLQEAKRAGIDFVVISLLDYNDDLTPSEISLFIYKVSSKERLMESRIQVIGHRLPKEEYEYMKTVARGLVSYIQ